MPWAWYSTRTSCTAWLASVPLAQLGIHGQPWRGSARPGALYTEYLGGGWYAGYACLGWR